ncbi:MAG: four helix bundle protein [Adhaeribacter sp.]
MEKRYLSFEDIEAYKVAFRLSNIVWDVVIRWNNFSKDTIGKQFVRAVNSISANIAEGYGRFTKKDKVNFYRYAKGSVLESIDWFKKAKTRKLISEEEAISIESELEKLPRLINWLIKYTNDNLTV